MKWYSCDGKESTRLTTTKTKQKYNIERNKRYLFNNQPFIVVNKT